MFYEHTITMARSRDHIFYIGVFVALLSSVGIAVSVYDAIQEINNGGCITRCIAQLGMRAKVQCIALCVFNPNAF